MHKFGKIILAMGMLSLLSVMPLAAQIDNGLVFKAPIPFYAGNVKWPAGSYIVTQPNPNEWNLVLRNIAGTKGEIINFIPTSSLDPQKESKVIFQKYGDTGYLQTLLVDGETEEIEFPLAKTEAKAKTMAKNTNKDTKVVEQATLFSHK